MRIPLAWAAAPFYYLYQAVCATLRFHERRREAVDSLDAAGERMVFCLWHDELFPLMRVRRDLDIVTVVSPSRDGELLARVLEKLGLRTGRVPSDEEGRRSRLHHHRRPHGSPAQGQGRSILSERPCRCLDCASPHSSPPRPASSLLGQIQGARAVRTGGHQLRTTLENRSGRAERRYACRRPGPY